MPTSHKIREQITRASWIRRMFEEGLRLKKLLGPERVFDYSLGNPVVDPPPELHAALMQLAAEDSPGAHRYMPNAGFPEVQAAIAAHLGREHRCAVGPEQIVMTVGAAGALNCVLKAILDPGDEVLVLVPFFPEYEFYIDNHGGVVVRVETDADFNPDPAAVARAITPRTRAIILNSPNNPTGRVYDAACLHALAGALAYGEGITGRPIYLLSDEPYRRIVYGGVEVPSVFGVHPASVVCTSHSKDLAIPGERIGYAAINPRFPHWQQLFDCMAFTNRVLGYINAPALQQRLVALLQEVSVPSDIYLKRRDLLLDVLRDAGWHVPAPDGAFYLFAATPIPDDLAFVELLKQHGVLMVPGRGFGRPGYVRISYCMDEDLIERSRPHIKAALAELAAAQR